MPICTLHFCVTVYPKCTHGSILGGMLRGAQEWMGYRRDAFGDTVAVWNDGPDFAELLARWTADPALVESMLVHGLAARDPLAAECLLHLPLTTRSRAGFEKVLTACLGTAAIGFHLKALEALHALSSDESWSGEVVRVLQGGGYWGDRMEAARILGGFRPTASLIQSLSQAIADPDYLVRRQAANTLLRYSGRASDISALPQVYDRIRSGTSAQDWAAASSDLATRAMDYAATH